MDYRKICSDKGKPTKTVLECIQYHQEILESIQKKLSDYLKNILSITYASENKIIFELFRKLGTLDVLSLSKRGVSIQQFLLEIEPPIEDSNLKQAYSDFIAAIPQDVMATKIESFLGLNQPIKDHPLFQDEVQMDELRSIFATSKSAQLYPSLAEEFVIQYFQYDGPIDKRFWEMLRNIGDDNSNSYNKFKQPQIIRDLKFTIILASLTKNHLPLINKLQQMRYNSNEKIKLQYPRDLVKISADDWKAYVADSQVGIPDNIIEGKTQTDKICTYVNFMVQTIRCAFPTAAFSHDLSNNTIDDIFIRENDKNDVLSVIENSPDLELLDDDVNAYLESNKETAFRGINGGEDKQKQLTKHLKKIQRVLRLTPNYASSKTLLKEGLDSAFNISHLPESTFTFPYYEQSVSTKMDTRIKITLAGSNKNNDYLVASIISFPSHGSLSDIDQSNGTVNYTPETGFTGVDSFIYKLKDSNADSYTANVTVHVNPILDK